MKAEYDLSKMKRMGHPLRDKVARGEIKLINPLDLPNMEENLAKQTPEEQRFIIKFLASIEGSWIRPDFTLEDIRKARYEREFAAK